MKKFNQADDCITPGSYIIAPDLEISFVYRNIAIYFKKHGRNKAGRIYGKRQ